MSTDAREAAVEELWRQALQTYREDGLHGRLADGWPGDSNVNGRIALPSPQKERLSLRRQQRRSFAMSFMSIAELPVVRTQTKGLIPMKALVDHLLKNSLISWLRISVASLMTKCPTPGSGLKV